jgi:hypothetical protein
MRLPYCLQLPHCRGSIAPTKNENKRETPAIEEIEAISVFEAIEAIEAIEGDLRARVGQQATPLLPASAPGRCSGVADRETVGLVAYPMIRLNLSRLQPTGNVRVTWPPKIGLHALGRAVGAGFRTSERRASSHEGSPPSPAPRARRHQGSIAPLAASWCSASPGGSYGVWRGALSSPASR